LRGNGVLLIGGKAVDFAESLFEQGRHDLSLPQRTEHQSFHTGPVLGGGVDEVEVGGAGEAGDAAGGVGGLGGGDLNGNYPAPVGTCIVNGRRTLATIVGSCAGR
jgi:hypothetical protein